MALIAVPAVNMCLGTDKVAFFESPHGPACLHDVPGEFVAHDMRSLDPVLCPLVPHIDMDICATDRGIVDLDQHLVFCDRWDVHLRQCCPPFWTCLLYTSDAADDLL